MTALAKWLSKRTATRSNTPQGRRTFLRGCAAGIGATALALPTFEGLLNGNGTAYADGTPLPKRFGVWYFGNGIRSEMWMPVNTGPGWMPPQDGELEPLMEMRDKVTVVSGMDVPFTVGAHAPGHFGMLCGSFDEEAQTGHAPSIDQVIAHEWATTDPRAFGSIQAACSIRGKGSSERPVKLSRGLDGGTIRPAFYPGELFDRLFMSSAFSMDAQEEARRRMRGRALDVVLDDARELRQRLGVADQRRLDAHMQNVSELRDRLTVYRDACAMLPSRPEGAMEDPGHELLEEKNEILADILVMAMACGLSRVFSYQFTCSQADTLFWQLGATEGLHVLTHDDRPDTTTPGRIQAEKVHECVRFTMAQLNVMLRKMDAVQEGEMSLLDRSCVMVTSEVSHNHSKRNMPVLLCGGAGGRLRQGIHHAAGGQSSSRVLLTALRAMDIDAAEFGEGAGHVTEPLHELLL